MKLGKLFVDAVVDDVRTTWVDLFERAGLMYEPTNVPGDLAQASVIAHEVGHHVQTLLGIEAQVRKDVARHGQLTPGRPREALRGSPRG